MSICLPTGPLEMLGEGEERQARRCCGCRMAAGPGKSGAEHGPNRSGGVIRDGEHLFMVVAAGANFMAADLLPGTPYYAMVLRVPGNMHVIFSRGRRELIWIAVVRQR